VFPPEILDLPSVGTHMRPNIEMIVGLKPDLVLQSATRGEEPADLERLQGAGIPVAIFAPRTFKDIFDTMDRLGVLTGREANARNAVAGLRGRLDAVRERLSRVESPARVFFEVRAEPLAGAGHGSIVQEVLTAAGAENVTKSQKAIVQYGFENLLLDDPDIYIMQRGPMNRNPIDPKQRPHFSQLKSVRAGKVFFVDEYTYSRPGPRCVDAVEDLAARLYPESLRP
jgi:iron complex transport system substrate-binding protein